LPLDDTIGNSDMMPIWNRKAHQGQSLHRDALETSLVETIRTGAIGDGATKKSINLSGLECAQNFITELPPPAYPFAIDQALNAEDARPKKFFRG
jgi:hypothetical protein